jgi:hypothetical protein
MQQALDSWEGGIRATGGAIASGKYLIDFPSQQGNWKDVTEAEARTTRCSCLLWQCSLSGTTIGLQRPPYPLGDFGTRRYRRSSTNLAPDDIGAVPQTSRSSSNLEGTDTDRTFFYGNSHRNNDYRTQHYPLPFPSKYPDPTKVRRGYGPDLTSRVALCTVPSNVKGSASPICTRVTGLQTSNVFFNTAISTTISPGNNLFGRIWNNSSSSSRWNGAHQPFKVGYSGGKH